MKPEKARRFWRWLASLDLTKPPAPVLRWLGLLLVAIGYVAAGTPVQGCDWLWPAIFAGALILPDLAGFAIGGFRLDLKQAQDDIERLKLRIDLSQIQVTGDLNLYGEEAGRVAGRALLAARGEQAARNAQFVLVDDDTAMDVTS